MTKYSVIIPAYNCAKTIENTVDSILASGLKDFEIVIVDDGSTDGTSKICDEMVQQHERIRCVHQENAGVSAARNRGIREADGEYIWFFDADDSVGEGALKGIENVISDNNPDMLIFGVSFDYYHNGVIYRRDELLPPVEGDESIDECKRMLYELFDNNCLSAVWNKIIRRSIVENNELMLREDMFLYEDLEFSLRVLARCNNVYFCREAIYRYRQSEDEGSAGRRLKKIPHIPELLIKISEALADAQDKNKILLSLYLTLARERISVSTKEEISIVCSDFKEWIDENELYSKIEQNEYVMLIYNSQVTRLMARREYSKLRHSFANWIKQNIGDFRKW